MSTLIPDVICITETWLRENISDSALLLKKYTAFRKDRLDGFGGVLIAVKSVLNPTLSETISYEQEALFVNVKIGGANYKIVCVYRPPSLNSTENEQFVNFLQERLRNSPNFVLIGDFNDPNIEWLDHYANNSYEQKFIDFINELNLTQFVESPTRGCNILPIKHSQRRFSPNPIS